MDFSLNEEQRHWQSEARRFSDEEVRPISLARDQIADPRATLTLARRTLLITPPITTARSQAQCSG